MRYRNVDSSGDWTFGSGKNNYAVDKEAVKLHVRGRIKSHKGDCFFAKDEGIDWKTRMGNFGERDLLDVDIRTVIVQTLGVSQLTDFYSSYDEQERVFTPTYEISTIYSESFLSSISETV